MARKSGPKQLKRAPAPAFWSIHRKEAKWAPRTRAGPHSRNRSLPLVLILRELLKYAETAKEATRIISDSKIRVDSVVRRDRNFPVGLMDVIHIEGPNQTFRLLPQPGRGLSLIPIEGRESGQKICKIIRKTTIRSGRLQVGLHDGRNLTVNLKDLRKDSGDLTVGGSVQLTLPTQQVLKYIPLQQGSIGLVTDGKNQGIHGKIVSISGGSYGHARTATIETGGGSFDTPADYVIPVGTNSPLVTLGR